MFRCRESTGLGDGGGGADGSLADALGQGGLAVEARALLRAALLPSSPWLLEADALQVGWIPGPLWEAGRGQAVTSWAHFLAPTVKTLSKQTSTLIYSPSCFHSKCKTTIF